MLFPYDQLLTELLDLEDESFGLPLDIGDVDAAEYALGRIPPERRRAFTLFEYDGYNYAEIAQMTGVPLGTVKSRISTARGELKEELAKKQE